MKYEIGPRLRKYREAQNMSQKEFSKQIGVSNSRVSNWEQGISRPNADILAAICSVLKVSPDDLLNVRLNPEDMDEHEKKVIMAYRTKANLQEAVDILLGVEPESDDR